MSTVRRIRKEHSGLFWDDFQNLLTYSEAISFQKVKETFALSNRKRVAGTWKSRLEHSARKTGTAGWASRMNNLFWRKVLEIDVLETETWNDCFLLVIVEVVLFRQRKCHILAFQCAKDHDKCKKQNILLDARFSICFVCETEAKRFFVLSSFENVVYASHIGGLCFDFFTNDLIYCLLFFHLNDLWLTTCVPRILSLEQHLYHVIPIKPLYPGNRLQVFIIIEAIVLFIWKVFLIPLFPPMLGNVNRAAATGIPPVSAAGTVLSNSTKGIKLRDAEHSWCFRHLKMGYFKLLHSSGDYLYISEKAS